MTGLTINCKGGGYTLGNEFTPLSMNDFFLHTHLLPSLLNNTNRHRLQMLLKEKRNTKSNRSLTRNLFGAT